MLAATASTASAGRGPSPVLPKRRPPANGRRRVRGLGPGAAASPPARSCERDARLMAGGCNSRASRRPRDPAPRSADHQTHLYALEGRRPNRPHTPPFYTTSLYRPAGALDWQAPKQLARRGGLPQLEHGLMDTRTGPIHVYLAGRSVTSWSPSLGAGSDCANCIAALARTASKDC